MNWEVRLSVFKLLQLFVSLSKGLNIFIKDRESFFIWASSGKGDKLSDVVNIALQAVYQRGIVHSETFFLLTEKVIIFNKAHRVLLMSVVKIDVCIFSFEEIVR